jgi:hypothetical protein
LNCSLNQADAQCGGESSATVTQPTQYHPSRSIPSRLHYICLYWRRNRYLLLQHCQILCLCCWRIHVRMVSARNSTRGSHHFCGGPMGIVRRLDSGGAFGEHCAILGGAYGAGIDRLDRGYSIHAWSRLLHPRWAKRGEFQACVQCGTVLMTVLHLQSRLPQLVPETRREKVPSHSNNDHRARYSCRYCSGKPPALLMPSELIPDRRRNPS